MTKKDFEVIAEVLKSLDLGQLYKADLPILKPQIAEQFADRLALLNPRFNRERFLEACK